SYGQRPPLLPLVGTSNLLQERQLYHAERSPSLLYFKHLAQTLILDSSRPNQYGPRGFGGGIVVILRRPARVSKAWPTTHAKKTIAHSPRPKRPPFPRDLSVWASSSATPAPIGIRKGAPIDLLLPIRRRWPEVFGSRPSSSLRFWSARRSVGCSITCSEFRPGD